MMSSAGSLDRTGSWKDHGSSDLLETDSQLSLAHQLQLKAISSSLSCHTLTLKVCCASCHYESIGFLL